MEKNGNTYAPGDSVVVRRGGNKLASTQEGTLVSIDPDTNRARVKTAGGAEVFVDVNDLGKPAE